VDTQRANADDAMPRQRMIIEVKVAELQQLFRAIDPSPFGDRQLDPDIEEFIVYRAREVPKGVPFGLMVYLDHVAGAGDDAAALSSSVRQFFSRRAEAARRELRELFRRGRLSLLIGLAVLGTFGGFAQALGSGSGDAGFASVLRESLIIGGWVAMWRPLEVFLYDWWPIRAQARCYDRLAIMPVAVQYTAHGESRDWRTPERAISGG
jgi:hypothetical protein